MKDSTKLKRIQKAKELGYHYECEVCGMIADKDNFNSKCDWSLLYVHGWRLAKND